MLPLFVTPSRSTKTPYWLRIHSFVAGHAVDQSLRSNGDRSANDEEAQEKKGHLRWVL